jgi:hypothetical protein
MRSQSGEGCRLVNDLASIMGSIYRWIATSSLRAASWRPWPVKRISSVVLQCVFWANQVPRRIAPTGPKVSLLPNAAPLKGQCFAAIGARKLSARTDLWSVKRAVHINVIH